MQQLFIYKLIDFYRCRCCRCWSSVNRGSVQKIILYRALLKDNLIKTFKDPLILHVNLVVTFIGNNVREEEGKVAGVLHDALSTFWNQLFNSLTVGAQEKVPAIRHDYQRAEWQAIARILKYGYIKERYFPLPLSRAFVALCLFGEESITSDFLLSSFRLYISEDERRLLRNVLRKVLMMIMMTCLIFFLITSVIKLPQKKTYCRLFLNLLTRKSFRRLDMSQIAGLLFWNLWLLSQISNLL